MYISMYIHIHTYTYTYTYTYMYVYIYIYSQKHICTYMQIPHQMPSHAMTIKQSSSVTSKALISGVHVIKGCGILSSMSPNALDTAR